MCKRDAERQYSVCWIGTEELGQPHFEIMTKCPSMHPSTQGTSKIAKNGQQSLYRQMKDYSRLCCEREEKGAGAVLRGDHDPWKDDLNLSTWSQFEHMEAKSQNGKKERDSSGFCAAL